MGQFLNLFKQAAPEKKPTSPKKEATTSSEKKPVRILLMRLTTGKPENDEMIPKSVRGKKVNQVFQDAYIARLKPLLRLLYPSEEKDNYKVTYDPKVDYFNIEKLDPNLLLAYVRKASSNARHFIPFGTFALKGEARKDADRVAELLGYEKVNVRLKNGEKAQKYRPSSQTPGYVPSLIGKMQEGKGFTSKRQEDLVKYFNNLRDSHIHYLSNIPGITLSPEQQNQIKNIAQKMSYENRSKASESTRLTKYKDGRPYKGYSDDMQKWREQLNEVYLRILKGVDAKDKNKPQIEQQMQLRFNSAPYIANNKTQYSNTMVS